MAQYWTDLGLEQPPASEEDVREAFANRLRKVRPDRDPDGFERLNAARDAALAMIRWKDASQRFRFADGSGMDHTLPARIYQDRDLLLRDRVAMLMNRPADRLHMPNWVALTDEGLSLPTPQKLQFKADYLRELMKLHAFYRIREYRTNPIGRPVIFTPERAEVLLNLAGLHDRAEGSVFDPLELDWLEARMGLRETFSAPRSFVDLKVDGDIPMRTWLESLAALAFVISLAAYAALQ